jgi:hypothetical protein
MALNAQIALSILAHETSIGDLSRTLRATPANYALSITDGTGANQAQVVWSASGSTPGFGGYVDFNLQSLPDDRGTVSMTYVKGIYIKNTNPDEALLVGADWNDTTPQNRFYYLPLYRNQSNGAGEPIRLTGTSFFFVFSPSEDGYQVGATSKIIRLSATDGGAPSYEIVLIGEGTVT